MFVSRSLSYSVIFLSVFMKLPQVLALYNAGTSRGVSPRAYWLEIAWYVRVQHVVDELLSIREVSSFQRVLSTGFNGVGT